MSVQEVTVKTTVRIVFEHRPSFLPKEMILRDTLTGKIDTEEYDYTQHTESDFRIYLSMGNWREYVRIWALRAKYSNYWMQVASIVGNEFENISKRFHGATITRITMHVVEGQRKEEGVRNVLIPNHVLKTHI